MSKKIGIVGFIRNDMFGVHEDYLHFAENFGSPVVIPPVSRKDFFRNFKIEGLILPGGADINPIRYAGNKLQAAILKSFFCYPPDPYQEYFDTELLPGLLHAGFPVFGICRGLQTLNVHLGGTLRNVDRHPKSKSKTDLVHPVFPWTTGHTDMVNSFHHQAVGRLAEGLEVKGYSQDDVAERVVHKTLPIAAVQYHPERMNDEWSMSICRTLFS
jgi:putative glutamine amidotransferase